MEHGKSRFNAREVSAGDFMIPLRGKSNSQQTIQAEFPESGNKMKSKKSENRVSTWVTPEGVLQTALPKAFG